jgi:hypothetical protein
LNQKKKKNCRINFGGDRPKEKPVEIFKIEITYGYTGTVCRSYNFGAKKYIFYYHAFTFP